MAKKKRKLTKRQKKQILSAIIFVLLAAFYLWQDLTAEEPEGPDIQASQSVQTEQGGQFGPADQTAADSRGVTLADIPDYSGDPWVELNNNEPEFEPTDYTVTSYEEYGALDELGRCTTVMACIGRDLMPTEKRGDISSVRPTGWVQAQYDFVDGKALYNRCHLIGFQLTGENANDRNLITGTRYLNVEGMLPFENLVADYIKETGNHVLYRVTPIYNGDNLVADGVQMEARSVEDDGEGITYHVYCYNVQPGVGIDYATGESWLESTTSSSDSTQKDTKPVKQDTTKLTKYVLNTSTMKFHKPDCSGVEKMSKDNRRSVKAKRESLIQQGYSPCGQCKP